MPLVDPDENKLGVESDLGAQSSKINLKTPKRVLHFSDGVLEEYSTDEDEADNTQVAERVDTEFKRKEAEKKVEEEQSKGWSQPATISGNVTNNKVRSDQPGAVTIDAEKVAS